MKKIFALTLVIVICLSIAACDLFAGGNGDDVETTTEDVTTPITIETTETTETTTATTAEDPLVEPDDESDPAKDDIF